MTDEAAHLDAALAALDDTTLAVRDLISASQDLTARMARRMRMNVSDMTAILMLSERGPMGGTELARLLGVSTAAITILVDRLERSGHVERSRDPGDGRRVRVSGTTTARTAALRAWMPAIQDLDEVCRSLSASERAVARDVLGRLSAAMARGAQA
ncbi:MarR family winged helix-turn-helix transcriptional regulator [Pseudonocardia pini]|uniref:MarR family winged helix-turn-helix transcriptional regulator n=1 Tax=Pseudonocardia pini TaxID=2758030 RepID=UPI0015F0D114|nr:MarR family transcriptional regulator [Pseudonocardia pini]